VIAEASTAGELNYLAGIAGTPGFPRAALATLERARLAGVTADALARIPRTGADLGVLARRLDEAMTSLSSVDYARLLTLAAESLERRSAATTMGRAIVLLDVPLLAPRERAWIDALLAAGARVACTVPAADRVTRDTLAAVASVDWYELPSDHAGPLARAQEQVFREGADGSDALPGGTAPDTTFEFFSAPGEGREAIEIVRRVLTEASRGVRFDRMAVVLRSPNLYSTHLEAAFHRAGVPAYFARGTRRPDPAGRALLALLACADEGCSAARFAEYVSLARLPTEPDEANPLPPTWVPPGDEVLRSEPAARVEEDAEDGGDPGREAAGERPRDRRASPMPWRWERLLDEAGVIGGAGRWRVRLAGLRAELARRAGDARREDAGSARALAIDRDIEQLRVLERFAVPIVEEMASWDRPARWGEWIERLERLAARALADPERPLAVIADARPLAPLGPVTLGEVREVLTPRLATVQRVASASRFGRVFVGTSETVRGRSFDVVFVPGLAERVFPQRIRKDPLLPDAAREAMVGFSDEALARAERLELQLAVGAASRALYASYPSMDALSARPRVPSFYALDLYRAACGHLPDHQALARAAAATSGARLAWPAPPDPRVAIDAAEHDLAQLRRWLLEADPAAARGRARYLLELSPVLARSLRTRYARWRPRWTAFDGLDGEPHGVEALAKFRLHQRAYSPSALQRFASCPFRFYLGSVLMLAPREERQAVHRLDPATRGRLAHDAIAAVTRALIASGRWPVTPADVPPALERLADVLARVAAHYREELAPRIDGVWRAEIEALHADLRGWLTAVAASGDGWKPRWVEFAFGINERVSDTDPESHDGEVIVENRWRLRGIVDAIEEREGSRQLRVTDYKTGRDTSKGPFQVGGGQVLQPILYALAVERALGASVCESRLFFCTMRAGFVSRTLKLAPDPAPARARAIEVLEIIDRALELGFLPQAPRPDTCARCEFRPVCGPHEEHRVTIKDADRLGDLRALRQCR
jgi:CRISPR/Cas system-associated exonuclease Cas4 (RecB family)